jgi:UDP-N-acetylmuramoyl-tripeptide--D-alanyl-D-alanine ligase
VALITNVAPAHLEGFGSIEGVAKAKAEIYEGLPKEGIAILNADDPFVSMWKTIVKDKTTVTFGLNQPADFTASNIKLSAQGQPQFDVNSPKGTFTIRLPLLGEHNVKNALAAIACSYALGVDEEAIIKGLEDLLPVNNRLVRYKGLSGSLVIDDSYNANPLSVTAALKTLATFKGEKIFVFGDMAELGPDQEKFHTEVGNQAKALGIDKLYACGKLSALAVLAFGDKGVFFEDQESLTHSLKQDLHDNATVLVKGSRISQMENIVQAIIQEI